MKTRIKLPFLFLLASFLLITGGCRDEKPHRQEALSADGMKKQLEANHIMPVKNNQDVALHSVMDFATRYASPTKSKGVNDKNLEIIATLDGDVYTAYRLPMYYVDTKLFKADPRPENLMNCLYQPEDGKLYVVTEKDKILFSMFLRLEKDEWLPNRIIWETDAWLKDLIMDEQNTDFAVFYFNHLHYYTYLHNNERIYMEGKTQISVEKICRTFSMILEAVEEAIENGEGILYI